MKKLKPKDIAKICGLRQRIERSWAMLQPDWDALETPFKELMEAPTERRGDGLVRMFIPRSTAQQLQRPDEEAVNLSYQFRVLFSIIADPESGALSRHMSVSRQGRPNVPDRVLLQIASELGFTGGIEGADKQGRAIHLKEPYEIETFNA